MTLFRLITFVVVGGGDAWCNYYCSNKERLLKVTVTRMVTHRYLGLCNVSWYCKSLFSWFKYSL